MDTKCMECSKNTKSYNRVGYVVGDKTICSNCCDKVEVYKSTKIYTSIEDVESDCNYAFKKMAEHNFSDETKAAFKRHFDKQIQYIENKKRIDEFPITTSYNYEGYKIIDYIDVVSGEIVIGTGVASSFLASVEDISGSEVTAYTSKLKAYKYEAKKRAIEEAIEQGANAMIGTKFDFVNFTNDKIGVIFSGTAIIREKIKD